MTYTNGMILTAPAGDIEVVKLTHQNGELVSLTLRNANGDYQKVPARIITDGIESGKITVKA